MKSNTQNTSGNQKNTQNSSNSNSKQSNSDRQFYNSYKYEVADELGVELGADETSRNNGRVGGQMTKNLVNRAKQEVDTTNMKYEFADELGYEIGPDATARQNGSVGGNITRSLVNRGKNSMKNNSNSNHNNQ